MKKVFLSMDFYLSFLRVSLCLILLSDLILALPTILEKDSFFYNNFSTLRLQDLEKIIPYLLVFYAFFLLLFLLGIGKGMVAFVLFFLSFSYHLVFHTMHSGSTMLATTTFLFMVPIDSYRYFSFWPTKSFSYSLEKSLHSLGLLFLYLHINYLFFSTAIHKLANDSWISGNGIIDGVLYYNFDVFNFLDFLFLLDETTLKALGYLVLILQLFFPILMFNKTTRLITFLLIVLSHVGIALVMYLFKFQAIVFILLPIVLFKNQIFDEIKKLYSK